MKKLISIILVVAMAFTVSTIALAEDGNAEDANVLLPLDPGENNENIYVELDEGAPDTLHVTVFGEDPEWVQEDKDFYLEWGEWVSDMVAERFQDPASPDYDETLVVNTVQLLGWAGIWDELIEDNVAGVGGRLFIKNDLWLPDDVIRVLQAIWDDAGDFDWQLLPGYLTFDAATGEWWIDVPDFGMWSEFWALIERLIASGVDPKDIPKILGDRSPSTSDNSVGLGIVLLIVLGAAAITTVSVKKARQHD